MVDEPDKPDKEPRKIASKWSYPGPGKDPDPEADFSKIMPPATEPGEPATPDTRDEARPRRARKHRPEKPFKLNPNMGGDRRSAAYYAAKGLTPEEAKEQKEREKAREARQKNAARRRDLIPANEVDKSANWSTGNNLDWLHKVEPPAKIYRRWKRLFDPERKGKEFDPEWLSGGKWIPIFLVVLEATDDEWKAIDEARVNIRALQARKAADPVFQDACQEASSRFHSMLKREYIRNAIIGNPKYTPHQGKRGEIIKMEKDLDALAVLVKAYYPELRVTPDKEGDEKTGQAVGEALRSFLGIDESGKTVNEAIEGAITVVDRRASGRAESNGDDADD